MLPSDTAEFTAHDQSINQSLFAKQTQAIQLQANKKNVWQAARTGNSPTKLATLDRKTDR